MSKFQLAAVKLKFTNNVLTNGRADLHLLSKQKSVITENRMFDPLKLAGLESLVWLLDICLVESVNF